MQDYFDGELSQTEKDKIQNHLTSCPSCHQQAMLLKVTRNILKHLPDARPSMDSDYWERAVQGVIARLPSSEVPA